MSNIAVNVALTISSDEMFGHEFNMHLILLTKLNYLKLLTQPSGFNIKVSYFIKK